MQLSNRYIIEGNIMKKIIKGLFGILFSFLFIFSLPQCSENKEEPWDGVLDGAYFITNDSYRSYVEDLAKTYNKNTIWVNRVLKGYIPDEDTQWVKDQKYFYCVIIENKIKTAFDMTYEFTTTDNGYIGHMSYHDVSFYNEGNILHLTDGGKHSIIKRTISIKETKIEI